MRTSSTAHACETQPLFLSRVAPLKVSQETQLTAEQFDEELICESRRMKDFARLLKKFAKTPITILLTGETGVGKSFIAKAIHRFSDRFREPFVSLNCANLPAELLESELFGHVRGSFTGAHTTRPGRFEAAGSGTIFLDEIGEIPEALQRKLLRILDTGEFEKLGSNQTQRSRARVIAATNKDLQQLVATRTFREDLYYRLSVFETVVPPLRDRQECFPKLTTRLVANLAAELKGPSKTVSDDVLRLLAASHFPGNIREYSNTLRRLVLLSATSYICLEDAEIQEALAYSPSSAVRVAAAAHRQAASISATLLESEEAQIRAALMQCHWVQKEAAKRLGVSPRALNYKIRKFGITHPKWRQNKI